MMVEREKELHQLQEAYASAENRMVILYGRLGAGKTTLVNEFAEGKEAFYYQASQCSEHKQLELLQQSWESLYALNQPEEAAQSGIARTRRAAKGFGYLGLFYRALASDKALDIHGKPLSQGGTGKKLIILEDFLWIAKNDPGFYEDIVKLMQQEEQIMLVLTASTLIWREEELKIEPRSFVRMITDRIYLENFQFLELVKYFPELSVGDIIQVYALLGGVPAYLKHWDVSTSLRDNILRLFVRPDAILAEEAYHYMRMGLRELSLYNTVLNAMTSGVTRLNDMFISTGFNRAKISVYMKNLKQLGIVDKCRVLDVKCRDQEIKGMYEITDPLVHFWYRFLFGKQTLRMLIAPEEYYDREIAPYLEEYTSAYFEKVCRQYLNLMNLYDKLPIHYKRAGAWYGKNGRIPMLAADKEGKLLAVYSKWSEEPFDTEDLEQILQYLMNAGINPECYYLFSRSDFDDALRRKAGFVHNIQLVDLAEM